MSGQLTFAYLASQTSPPAARRRVCDLPAEERPLYRLNQHGGDALANSELLALVVTLPIIWPHREA
jgi:hypothetical protein